MRVRREHGRRQGDGVLTYNGTIPSAYLEQMSFPLTFGMTPVVCYWSDSNMRWLDSIYGETNAGFGSSAVHYSGRGRYPCRTATRRCGWCCPNTWSHRCP